MVVPFAPGGVYDTMGRVYARGAFRHFGPTGHRRERARRRQLDRRRADRARRSRRLSAAAWRRVTQRPSAAHPQGAALRCRDRFRSRCLGCPAAAHPDHAARHPGRLLPDFIAYAKANQTKMQYGSPGTGTGSHLACALFNVRIGVEITHVPYRGLAPAMQDLLAGRIDYMCPTITTAMAQLQSHAVQAPAVIGSERSPSLPRHRHRRRAGAERLCGQQLERDLFAQGDACRRSSPSSMRRCSRRWRRPRWSSACTSSARHCRRRNTAPRNICKASLQARSKPGAMP